MLFSYQINVHIDDKLLVRTDSLFMLLRVGAAGFELDTIK